jgi:hypothetical protein
MFLKLGLTSLISFNSDRVWSTFDDGTAMSLESSPFSSSVINIPIGRVLMTAVGSIDSSPKTSTSSASPSPARVCGMNP